MEVNPYESTLHTQAPEPKTPQFRSTLLGCLAVIGIVGLLGALLLPMRRSAGEPARRMSCRNNLTQIALALHTYEQVWGTLPPAYTVDAEGKPLHSWRTLILPQMEQGPLYEKIDLSKPWDDPANKVAFEIGLHYNACPSTDLPSTHTTYMAIVVPGGCFRPAEPRKLSEITDDKGLTLMVIEVDAKQAVHWMSPKDCVDLAFLKPESGAKLPHPRVFQAVCVDGTVRILRQDPKPEVIRALITIDGHDDTIAQQAE